MPGNIVKINGSKKLEWYVGDSQIEKVIAVLDKAGFKESAKDRNDKNKPETNTCLDRSVNLH